MNLKTTISQFQTFNQSNFSNSIEDIRESEVVKLLSESEQLEFWQAVDKRWEEFEQEAKDFVANLVATGQACCFNNRFFRLNNNHLHAFKKVFGESVSAIYFEIQTYNIDSVSRIDDVSVTDTGKTIDIDIGGMDILVEFNQHHRVLFTNSEWGSLYCELS